MQQYLQQLKLLRVLAIELASHSVLAPLTMAVLHTALTFSADDEVTIIATVGVDATDVGEAGAIHVAGKLAGGSFVYLDEDGLFATWNPLAGLPGATVVTDSLKASYTVTVVNASKLPVGKHRFALAYSTGGVVIYTGKALEITITE